MFGDVFRSRSVMWGACLTVGAGTAMSLAMSAPARANSSLPAPTSFRVAAAAAGNGASIRVMTYNIMSASFDGERHPGGVAAPFSLRRSGQIALIRRSHAAVIGLEEASACLHPVPHKPCFRQIDSLARGVRLRYRLDPTYERSGPTRYQGNYIMYDPNRVARVGRGGNWSLGPSNDERHSAYQVFRVVGSDAKFLFVDTHLVSCPASCDVTRGRETKSLLRQAEVYAKRMGVTSLVYAGDFNSYRGEWHIHDITGNTMRAAGLRDGVFAARHLTNARFDSINQLYKRPRHGHGSADHVYASRGIAVKTWGELLRLRAGRFSGTIPSDHNPVYADLVLPAA